MTDSTVFKVGDTIVFKPGLGIFSPTEGTITCLEVTKRPYDKSGEFVNEIDMDLFNQNRVMFGINNNAWCFSEQVVSIAGIEIDNK